MSNASRTATVGAICALVLGLGPVACGGDSASSAGTQRASASGEEHTHASGETHSHEGESSQAEGSQAGTTHAHAAMDTVAAGVGLHADGSGLDGHVTVLRGADTVRVMVEVQGASADARYDVQLLAGDCGSTGSELTSLTPVLTGSSGSGSSQATIAGSAVSGHAHGAVHVEASGGGATACAPVHLGAPHSHGG